MDATSIANLSTATTNARNTQDVGTTVLKKAIDMSATTAAELIAALPVPASSNLPPNLGQNINTTA
jgi:hypothetical protein